MGGDLFQGGLLVFVLLFLSAFFSCTETALASLSAVKIKHLRENRPLTGKVLGLWLEHPQRLLAALLIATNAINLFAAVYANHLVGPFLGSWSVPVVTLFMTFFVVLFTQVIPKGIGKSHATILIIPLLTFFRIFYWFLLPFTWAMLFVNRYVASAFEKKVGRAAPQITEEELEFLINVGEEEGILAEQKHEMLSGVFELGDTVVREIMVHRIDMTAMSSGARIVDMAEAFRETGLSRIPVFDDRIDNIVGIVHAKDVLFHLKLHRENPFFWDATVNEIKREAVFVPESKPVDQLFQELRKQRHHMAIVLDEYGGTNGIVTMEDIFEEIVGEVRDEFDNEEDAIRPTPVPNQYLIECKVHIDDFCDFFDVSIEHLLSEENASEFDTLGGFVLHHFGQIPKIGDKLEIGHIHLEVIEVSRRRVRRVLARVQNAVVEESKSEISAGRLVLAEQKKQD